jgi:NADH:flavin oxidoreductase / NADH oxidase family
MTTPWDPIRIGAIEFKHRLAMAPMTRDRATPSGAPTGLNAEYYAQRASMGLVITEGTQPSADGQGYLLTPGCYTQLESTAYSAYVADPEPNTASPTEIPLTPSPTSGPPYSANCTAFIVVLPSFSCLATARPALTRPPHPLLPARLRLVRGAIRGQKVAGRARADRREGADTPGD